MNIFHFSQQITRSLFLDKLGPLPLIRLVRGRRSWGTLKGDVRAITRIFNLCEMFSSWVNTDSRRSTEVIAGAPFPKRAAHPPRLTNKQTIKNVQALFIKWIDLPIYCYQRGDSIVFFCVGELVVLWLINAASAVNKPFFDSRSVTLQLSPFATHVWGFRW